MTIRSITDRVAGRTASARLVSGLTVLGVVLPYGRLATLALSLLVILPLQQLLRRTYFGKAVRATAEDWQAAALSGIDVQRTYLLTFGLGAGLAGVAGALITRTLWLGGMAYPLALAAGATSALLFAMVIGVPTFRLRGVYFAIGTLGLTEMLRITVGNLLPTLTSLPADYVAAYDLTTRYETALGLATLCVLAAWLLLRSRLGLGILAVREDEEAAQATGIGALRHKLAALAHSSVFAGCAGGLFAYLPPQLLSAVRVRSGLNVRRGAAGLRRRGRDDRRAGAQRAALRARPRAARGDAELAVTLVQAHQIIFGLLFIVVVLALPGGLVDLWSRVRRPFFRPASIDKRDAIL